MGQKVNPHGLRVGVIKDWDSRWYEGDSNVQEVNQHGLNIGTVKDWNPKQHESKVIQFIRVIMFIIKVRFFLRC